MYGSGISREGEIIDLGVQAGVVDKSGAWYSYSGTRIGQGKDNVREYLKEHPELSVEIENKVRETQGIVSRAATFPASEAEASSEERTVGKEVVRTRRYRGTQNTTKKKQKENA